jgi:hypothetical protein
MRRGGPAWAWLLGLGLLVIVPYLWLANGPLQALWYDGLAVVGIVAMVVGIRRNRPEWSAGWWLLVAGQLGLPGKRPRAAAPAAPEFVVLLPGASAAEAVDLLDRLRPLTPAGCTFSAGVATWNGTESADELVVRADRTLYRAKEAGRDRVECDEAVVRA